VTLEVEVKNCYSPQSAYAHYNVWIIPEINPNKVENFVEKPIDR
jgi:hypothetical protein